MPPLPLLPLATGVANEKRARYADPDYEQALVDYHEMIASLDASRRPTFWLQVVDFLIDQVA